MSFVVVKTTEILMAKLMDGMPFIMEHMECVLHLGFLSALLLTFFSYLREQKLLKNN